MASFYKCSSIHCLRKPAPATSSLERIPQSHQKWCIWHFRQQERLLVWNKCENCIFSVSRDSPCDCRPCSDRLWPCAGKQKERFIHFNEASPSMQWNADVGRSGTKNKKGKMQGCLSKQLNLAQLWPAPRCHLATLFNGQSHTCTCAHSWIPL